jgi:transcription factor C subunit 6
MLASATGSGLCRVDVLSGRFMKEKTVKIPYGGVENMRLEGGNVDNMDVDSGEESY